MHPIGLGIRWVPEPKGKAGVYIIGDGSGFVKIGRARNITARLATLQGGNPRELKVVRFLPGAGFAEEHWLHVRFAVLRHRGEWFQFTEEMMTVSPGS